MFGVFKKLIFNHSLSFIFKFFFCYWISVFFYYSNAPELGAGIDPGMALTPFPYSILYEMRLEPTTF